MKGIFFALLILMSQAVSAGSGVSAFGLEFHKTKESDLAKQHKIIANKGINKYSGGNQYSIDTSQIGLTGLKSITVVFNKDKELVAILSTLRKSRYKNLKSILQKKYYLLKQHGRAVGNKGATFLKRDIIIELDAPHLSFEMTMNYLRADFLKNFKNSKEKDQKRKQQRENSLL